MLHVVDKDVLLEWSKTVQHLLVLYTTLICYSNIKEVQLTESSLYWHTQIYHTLMVPWLLAATTTLEPCSNRIERKGLAGNQSHFTAEMFQHRAIRQTAKLIKKRIMTEPLEIQKSQRNGCILSLKSTRTCVPDWESGHLRSLYKIACKERRLFFFFFRLPDALSVSSQATASWAYKALLNARSLTWLFYRFVSHRKIFAPLDRC